MVHGTGSDMAGRIWTRIWIVDDGGDATLFVHQGVKVEKDPSILDQPCSNKEFQIVTDRLRMSLKRSSKHWRSVAAKIR